MRAPCQDRRAHRFPTIRYAIGNEAIMGPNPNYRGVFMSVRAGERWRIIKPVPSNRSQIGFSPVPLENGVPITFGPTVPNDAIEFEVLIPVGAEWMIVYLSNQADSIDFIDALLVSSTPRCNCWTPDQWVLAC